MAKKKASPAAKRVKTASNSRPKSKNRGPRVAQSSPSGLRTYTIPDYRLEKPNFTLRQVCVGNEVRYEVESGDLSAPAPPIRESKYLSKEQTIEIYRSHEVYELPNSVRERLHAAIMARCKNGC